MNRFFKIAALASVATIALGICSANATMINGEVSFTSRAFTPVGGTGLGDATGVQFVNNTANAEACTGDFLAAGTCAAPLGTIQDFDFNPLGVLGGGGVGPIADFWTIGIFDFDLEAITIVMQTGTFLLLEGAGTLSGVGFDDTPGILTLSGQTAGGGTFSASFSTAADPTGVPEPVTLGLVGAGLVGLGVAAQRRRTH